MRQRTPSDDPLFDHVTIRADLQIMGGLSATMSPRLTNHRSALGHSPGPTIYRCGELWQVSRSHAAPSRIQA